ncbi:MAG: hypothetical protein K2R98_11575 [Gemmataceae bacterium]|nr:hypothetical protein [Gemmataceae bacterium]
MGLNSTPPNGADVLLECLIRHGVDTVFAYPGGATLPIHQALTRVQSRLRTILPRHEQGGGFAASGYARSSGKVGVCFATSGPGATNLVTCIADAQRDAVPMVAITGQVNRPSLGTDAFQEIPIVSVCRGITKHHYLVTRAEDIVRVMKEALHVATTGRPGPVIVDVPKDLQARRLVPDYDVPLCLPGYRPQPWQSVPTEVEVLNDSDRGPAAVLRQLEQAVRGRQRLNDTILTTGFGPAQTWVGRGYRVPTPQHWIRSTSLGSLGFALGAALGVQVGRHDKTVIAVDTVDSFLTNVQELACAYVEELPVKVLLLNESTPSDDRYPDFAELARGFLVEARSVADGDADDGIEQMLDASGPFVLDVHLSAARPAESRTHSQRWCEASVNT